MTDNAQAIAYAQADFSIAHQSYVTLFGKVFKDRPRRAVVLDLGCGPADVTIRFAKANPGWRFHGVDGSPAMLKCGRAALKRRPVLARRIRLIKGFIPSLALPRKTYDVILSSSLLHHLPDPQALWNVIRRHSRAGTLVFVADLLRPDSRARGRSLVSRYARGAPEVLRHDFFNSLLAAFTLREVREQVDQAGLRGFEVARISDRHLAVWGKTP